jgi:hypothetical protein
MISWGKLFKYRCWCGSGKIPVEIYDGDRYVCAACDNCKQIQLDRFLPGMVAARMQGTPPSTPENYGKRK